MLETIDVYAACFNDEWERKPPAMIKVTIGIALPRFSIVGVQK